MMPVVYGTPSVTKFNDSILLVNDYMGTAWGKTTSKKRFPKFDFGTTISEKRFYKVDF